MRSRIKSVESKVAAGPFVSVVAVMALIGCTTIGQTEVITDDESSLTGPSETGDTVVYYTSVYGVSGMLIETNSYLVAWHWNITDDRPLRDESFYNPVELTLGSNASGVLGPAFEAALFNRTPGEQVVTGIIPAKDTFTGPIGKPIDIPRRAGPFPVYETVPESEFRGRFPNATVGTVVKLNLRFFAQVEEIANSTVTYRILIEDGASVDLKALGPTAKLVTELDTESQVFFDRLDIEKNSSFRRQNDRILGITNGTYLVVDVTDEFVRLQKLKAPVYGHELEDVYFVIQIIDVAKRPLTKSG